jgi:small conductance mechanosensitive channel
VINLGSELLNPTTLTGALFYALAFLVLAILLARLLKLGVRQILHEDTHHHFDQTSLLFFTQLGQILVFIVAFTLYAHLVPALRALGTALLAGVSVVSIVVGLAAQKTLGNVIAGLSLLLYRPFLVGDQIQLNAPTGTEMGNVVRLSLGYTELLTPDNRRVVVPNSIIASQTIINFTTAEKRKICSVPMRISYDSDVTAARQIMTELAAAHPLVKEVGGCPLTQLGDYAITLTLYAWTANTSDALQVERDLYELIKGQFEREGITIPLPTSSVIWQNGQPATTVPN